MTRSLWMGKRSDKATSSSQQPTRANTDSASTTRWAHLLRNLWTLRLPYIMPSLYFYNIKAVLLTSPFSCRLRTKNAPRYLPNKVHHLNKHLRWRNPFSSSRASSRLLQGTRSTSAPERIAISARLGVQKGESSISASLRAWWWYAWLGFRYSLFVSFSREHGRATCEGLACCLGIWETSGIGGDKTFCVIL